MAMPDNLVFVRHGESEANVVNHAAKSGDDSLRSDAFRARHDSDMRLTSLGESQAQAAGAWIKENLGQSLIGNTFLLTAEPERQRQI